MGRLVSKHIVVAEHALALFPAPPSDSAGGEIDIRDLAGLFEDGVFTEAVDRYVSLRNQTSVTFEPPVVEITDHSGLGEVTSPMRDAANRLVAVFTRSDFSIDSYMWRISGQVTDSDPDRVIGSLAIGDKLKKLGRWGEDDEWKVSLLGLEFPSKEGLQWLVFLREDDESLSYTVTVRTERPFAIHNVADEWQSVWREIQEFIGTIAD